MPSTPLTPRRSKRNCPSTSASHGLVSRPLKLVAALALMGFSCSFALANEPTRPATAPPSEPKPTSELDALDLADKAATPEPPSAGSQSPGWRAFVEAAAGRNTLRGNVPDVNTRRLSADLRYDHRLSPTVRAVLSDRLDLADSDASPPARNVNTLREAYLSWAPTPAMVWDFGRVNITQGSAMGYNPTDWFKSGALRSVVSPDPAVLRENRQGTVVLRGQSLWEGGSLSGLVSPKLATSPDPRRYALDEGSTNPRHRWLLTGSHRISDRISPQWLLQGGDDQSTQLGVNLSALAGEATTVYAELATGRGSTLIDQARGAIGDNKRHTRAALGLTHTTSYKLVLTVEAQGNAAAPTKAQWQGLNPNERLAVLAVADREQDLPSRRALFVHALWKDVFVPRLDMAGYWRHDAETGSDEQWLELRYRSQRWEAALQWQHLRGDADSLLGAAPQTSAVELAFRFYF